MPDTPLIPPSLRAQLSGLRLLARRPAATQGMGAHASRSRGAGLEFAQYRAYEPGDDLRQVDWKLVARSDRFFVREAERDSPLQLMLLIDTSASMSQADPGQSAPTRLDLACRLAACAAELALRQNERFGLATLGQRAAPPVSAGGGARHRDRIAHALRRLTAQGAEINEPALRPLWPAIPAGAVVMLFSDGFDEALLRFAERLAATGRDVRLLQLLTRGETEFPYRGVPRLRDPETGVERSLDAGASRASFLHRFGEAQAELGQRCASVGIHYLQHDLQADARTSLARLCAPR